MELLKHMSLEQQSALLAQLKDYPVQQLANPNTLPSSQHFNPAFYSAAPSPYPFAARDDAPHPLLLKPLPAPFPAQHSAASDSQYTSMLHQFLRDGRGGVEYGREEGGGSSSSRRREEEESEGELSELSSDDISGSEGDSGRQQRQGGRVVVKHEPRKQPQPQRTSSQQTAKTAAAAAAAHPVITVTSATNTNTTVTTSASSSAVLSTPVRPLPHSKSSLVRPPSIRIPAPAVLTASATANPAGNGQARSPLTPWSPFTPLSPITPLTPQQQQSHQSAAALSAVSAPAASQHLAPSATASTPSSALQLLMPSHPPMVAPLSQSDMSPSSRFVLPQPSPLFQQQSFPQTPSSAFFSSSSLLAEPSAFVGGTPSTPALFHQSSAHSLSSPSFRNPFGSAPTPLLQAMNMPIGLSPMQSPFQSASSPYPYPSMSPPVAHNPRPLPSELIVNPHLAVSKSAPTSSTSASSSSSSSASSAAASRKRKLAAALPSSTSEDDSDAESEAAAGSTLSSEPVHNCPFTSCTKSFLKPSALKRHVRTHTGERPFVCSVSGCGLSFAERGNLKRHERVHSGLKPFRCDMCGHDFARRCHLMQHLKAKHPNLLLEE